MIKLDKRNVLLLHHMLTDETGGSAGVRDDGLLESTLQSAFQSFDGADLYPTIEEKAARLGFGLVANHAFADGNKRIGVLAMLVFLEVNGIKINPANEEIVRIGLGLADGSIKYGGLLNWIKENT